ADRGAGRGRGAPVPATRGRARRGAGGQRVRLSRAQARGMSTDGMLELSAAGAAGELAGGRLCAGELFDFYRDRAQADRDAGEGGLGCFTWVAPSRPANGAGRALAGVPLAVKDLFCTKDVPSQS